jgi:hypothetical protein
VIGGNQRITGLSAAVIADLVAEVGPVWEERHRARLASRPRKRAVGAGAKHWLVFVDRLLATLDHLRHGTTYDVLACWFGVDRSTITRAIGEVRPLLAERGCTITSGQHLRTLAEVVAHLGVSGQTAILDATEIRVRRPAAGRADRDRFTSGKSKPNAVEAMVITDTAGQLLFCGQAQPGSCPDMKRPESRREGSPPHPGRFTHLHRAGLRSGAGAVPRRRGGPVRGDREAAGRGDHAAFQDRDLSECGYVYVWAYGVHPGSGRPGRRTRARWPPASDGTWRMAWVGVPDLASSSVPIPGCHRSGSTGHRTPVADPPACPRRWCWGGAAGGAGVVFGRPRWCVVPGFRYAEVPRISLMTCRALAEMIGLVSR